MRYKVKYYIYRHWDELEGERSEVSEFIGDLLHIVPIQYVIDSQPESLIKYVFLADKKLLELSAENIITMEELDC